MESPAFGIVEILGIAASMSLLAGWRLYRVVLAPGLAMRVGASRQAINALETGRFDPSLPLAMRIAHAFETTVEAIWTLEDDD